MTTSVFVTDALKQYPYFKDLELPESQYIDVPDLPGARFLLSLPSQTDLSIHFHALYQNEAIQYSAYELYHAAIYFALPSEKQIQEMLIFNIGKSKNSFDTWFTLIVNDVKEIDNGINHRSDTNQNNIKKYGVIKQDNVPLHIQKALFPLASYTRVQLTRLGFVAIDPTAEEVAESGNMMLFNAIILEASFNRLNFNYKSILTAASSGGSIEVLERICIDFDKYTYTDQYADTHTKILSCIKLQILSPAAAHGHVHVLEWVKQKFPTEWLQFKTEHEAVFGRAIAVFQNAVKNGRFDILVWMRENELTLHHQLFETAAQFGHLHILEWASVNLLNPANQSNIIFTSSDMCYKAVYSGNLKLLQWLVQEQKCSLTREIFRWVAMHGNLDAIRWCIDQHCPWDPDVCQIAIRNNHFEAVQLLRSVGCPWDYQSLYAAAEQPNMEMFKWVIDHECPIYQDYEVAARAASWANVEIFMYIVSGDASTSSDTSSTRTTNVIDVTQSSNVNQESISDNDASNSVSNNNHNSDNDASNSVSNSVSNSNSNSKSDNDIDNDIDPDEDFADGNYDYYNHTTYTGYKFDWSADHCLASAKEGLGSFMQIFASDQRDPAEIPDKKDIEKINRYMQIIDWLEHYITRNRFSILQRVYDQIDTMQLYRFKHSVDAQETITETNSSNMILDPQLQGATIESLDADIYSN